MNVGILYRSSECILNVGILYRSFSLYHIHEITWEVSRTSLTVQIFVILGIAPVFQVILAFDPPGVKISSDSRGFPFHALVL